MNDLINYYVKILSNFNRTLQKKVLLIDKPWVLVDNDGEIQKLIFKENNSLILSKNGNVIEGSWEYFPEARALLINRITDKLLLKEQFIDENIIVLKKDGTEDCYFVFANENTIPDYDTLRYLYSLKCKKLNISNIKLLSGNIIEFHNNQYNSGINSVTEIQIIDDSYQPINLADGKYISKDKRKTFYISNGRITYVTYNIIRKLINGETFEIENGVAIYDDRISFQRRNVNKKVTINGKNIGNTRLTDEENIVYEIRNSIITSIFFLKDYETRTGQQITIEQKDLWKIKKGDRIVDAKPIYPLPDGDYK